MDYNQCMKVKAGEIYSYYLDYLFETDDKGEGFCNRIKKQHEV